MNRWARLGLGLAVFSGQFLSAADSAPAGPDIGLTAEERAWITDHPAIRAGHDPNYAPYAQRDATGQIAGIDPDYLELIAQRTGLKFQNETRPDWGKVIADFKAGEVDLLLSLNRDAERERYLIYTRPYVFAPNVIITRSDSPYLFAVGDLKGRTIAIPRNAAGLRRDLDQYVPGSVVVEYQNPTECYKAVALGEVFASIGEVANATYLIKLHRLGNLRLGRVISATNELYVGVRKDWPILAQILNKAIADIAAEERQRVIDRWIAVEVDPSTVGRWARAFKIAALVAALALGVFLVVFFLNRRLARELTERRRIQAELERTRDQLLRANQERRELMHMVAHDLRGPLTAIQLGMELLQREPPSGVSRATTTFRVSESADQMARLIDNLLSVENVEEGRFRLNFAAGDAGQLARAAVAAQYTSAQHKRITIEALLPDEPVRITTDFVALQQVVDNLLSNALKYTPPGTRVQIALSATATHCRLEVRDQGPGVEPGEREKIFEKFGRGSARPTQGEESIGLGLWIVRRFALALHGRVWCEPGPGGLGSAFIVEVPLKPPVGS